ncbi:MAG TPA: small ribosomal subunit Rsm22 family protein [Kiritimatiellia bacterium]|nr:small ribosomal subunit Rsm22 family protein [Kiritimatiellia bacterium]
MNYPGQLEHFWREQARRAWDFLPEPALLDRVRPHVQALSDRFTTERTGIASDYGDDADARIAYGLFFFPQTFVRTLVVLEECWRPPAEGSVRILDLGAGTGAAGLAALHRLGGRPARLLAVDRSAGSLAVLRDAAAECNALWPGAGVETDQSDLTARSDRTDLFDLILCSFALNELAERDPAFDGAAWLRGLLARLAPGGLLVVIEPALKVTAQRLEALRDRVAAEGWARIVGPCLHHGPCPLRAEGRFWCHEVRRWNPPPFAEKINRTLFRDLPHLKFSFLALAGGASSPSEPLSPTDASRARLVAPMTEERGKFVTRGCAADGALHDYEVLTRHLDRDRRAAVAAIERGARVAWGNLTRLGNGALRAEGVAPADVSPGEP